MVIIRHLYHHMIKSGGFIYIATVSVIPELLEGATFRQSIMEVNISFCWSIIKVVADLVTFFMV